jgi:hypothetical protein
VDMSSKTAVLVDNLHTMQALKNYDIKSNKGLYKKIFLDWDTKINKTSMQEFLLNKFTVVQGDNQVTIQERIELYLFGRIGVMERNQDIGSSQKEEMEFNKGFLTILELKDDSWKMILSTHEKNDDISHLIGKEWHNFLADTTAKAHLLKDPLETKLLNHPFYEIIHPYQINGKIAKLTIVHLNTKDNSEDNIQKIRQFLRTM